MTIRATAEFTVLMILAALRSLPGAVDHVQTGSWNRDLFQGRELFGKTVGIVGYGRLGRIVGRYLAAFDMRVLVHDPILQKASIPLRELLAASDIVTLHANWTLENDRFFDAACFNLMKPGSYFVNTARGELIDEKALLESLKSGKLAGAALDVLANEPASDMRSHPLVEYARSHSNLIITPHIGGCTKESMEKTEIFLAKKVCAFLRAHVEPGVMAHA
jgi:D-3-phosphoglycerate dehydrogenase